MLDKQPMPIMLHQIQVTPTHVALRDSAGLLVLTWADSHESHYPYWYLRGFCPCAACQGHGGQHRYVVHTPTLPGEVGEVGHYGLNIAWQDGHRTGIYHFMLLRQLCPCAACVGQNPSHVLQGWPRPLVMPTTAEQIPTTSSAAALGHANPVN